MTEEKIKERCQVAAWMEAAMNDAALNDLDGEQRVGSEFKQRRKVNLSPRVKSGAREAGRGVGGESVDAIEGARLERRGSGPPMSIAIHVNDENRCDALPFPILTSPSSISWHTFRENGVKGASPWAMVEDDAGVTGEELEIEALDKPDEELLSRGEDRDGGANEENTDFLPAQGHVGGRIERSRSALDERSESWRSMKNAIKRSRSALSGRSHSDVSKNIMKGHMWEERHVDDEAISVARTAFSVLTEKPEATQELVSENAIEEEENEEDKAGDDGAMSDEIAKEEETIDKEIDKDDENQNSLKKNEAANEVGDPPRSPKIGWMRQMRMSRRRNNTENLTSSPATNRAPFTRSIHMLRRKIQVLGITRSKKSNDASRSISMNDDLEIPLTPIAKPRSQSSRPLATVAEDRNGKEAPSTAVKLVNKSNVGNDSSSFSCKIGSESTTNIAPEKINVKAECDDPAANETPTTTASNSTLELSTPNSSELPSRLTPEVNNNGILPPSMPTAGIHRTRASNESGSTQSELSSTGRNTCSSEGSARKMEESHQQTIKKSTLHEGQEALSSELNYSGASLPSNNSEPDEKADVDVNQIRSSYGNSSKLAELLSLPWEKEKSNITEIEAREAKAIDDAKAREAEARAEAREAEAREAKARAEAREAHARAEAREAEAREAKARAFAVEAKARAEAREAEAREAKAKAEARELMARVEAEKAKAREAEAREVKAREAIAAEARAKEAQAKEAKAKEAKAMDAKAKEAKAMDAKAKEAKAKEAKAKEAKAPESNNNQANKCFTDDSAVVVKQCPDMEYLKSNNQEDKKIPTQAAYNFDGQKHEQGGVIGTSADVIVEISSSMEGDDIEVIKCIGLEEIGLESIVNNKDEVMNPMIDYAGDEKEKPESDSQRQDSLKQRSKKTDKTSKTAESDHMTNGGTLKTEKTNGTANGTIKTDKTNSTFKTSATLRSLASFNKKGSSNVGDKSENGGGSQKSKEKGRGRSKSTGPAQGIRFGRWKKRHRQRPDGSENQSDCNEERLKGMDNGKVGNKLENMMIDVKKFDGVYQDDTSVTGRSTRTSDTRKGLSNEARQALDQKSCPTSSNKSAPLALGLRGMDDVIITPMPLPVLGMNQNHGLSQQAHAVLSGEDEIGGGGRSEGLSRKARVALEEEEDAAEDLEYALEEIEGEIEVALGGGNRRGKHRDKGMRPLPSSSRSERSVSDCTCESDSGTIDEGWSARRGKGRVHYYSDDYTSGECSESFDDYRSDHSFYSDFTEDKGDPNYRFDPFGIPQKEIIEDLYDAFEDTTSHVVEFIKSFDVTRDESLTAEAEFRRKEGENDGRAFSFSSECGVRGKSAASCKKGKRQNSKRQNGKSDNSSDCGVRGRKATSKIEKKRTMAKHKKKKKVQTKRAIDGSSPASDCENAESDNKKKKVGKKRLGEKSKDSHHPVSRGENVSSRKNMMNRESIDSKKAKKRASKSRKKA